MPFSVFISMIRWKNSLLIIFSQILFNYFVFPNFKNPTYSHFEFVLLSFSTLCLAIGGYIINDIFDEKCDYINKPDKIYIDRFISKKKLLLSYYLISSAGTITGIILSFLSKKPLYSFLFIGIALSLYLYSSHLKKTPLLGNIIVSILVAFNTFIIVLFQPKQEINKMSLYYTIVFSLLAFGLNLIREIVKDIEDIKGDYNSKMNTLPIYIGIKRTKRILILFSFTLLYGLFYFLNNITEQELWKKCAFVLIIIVPFMVCIIKLYLSKTKTDFHKLSALLKGILFLGLLFIIAIQC